MPDQLWRTEWKSQHLRFSLVDCSQLTEKLAESHKTRSWISICYAKALTAGLLTSSLLENDERLTIRWQEDHTKLYLHLQLTPESVCECNHRKIISVLNIIPVEELENMTLNDGGAQINCQFCNDTYRFEAQDLRQIIDERIK